MNFQDHLNGFSKMRDETRSSSSGNRSHSSRSCGNRPISHAATNKPRADHNIDQKYHDFLNGVKETNKQPTQQRRRARYATGGHVALTKNNAERLAKQGRFGDTKLAKVGTLTAKLMDGLVHGGHKQINPKTGLREYWKCPVCTSYIPEGQSNCKACQENRENKLQKNMFSNKLYESAEEFFKDSTEDEANTFFGIEKRLPKLEKEYYKGLTKQNEKEYFKKNILPAYEYYGKKQNPYTNLNILPFNDNQKGPTCALRVSKKIHDYIDNFPENPRKINKLPEEYDYSNKQSLSNYQENLEELGIEEDKAHKKFMRQAGNYISPYDDVANPLNYLKGAGYNVEDNHTNIPNDLGGQFDKSLKAENPTYFGWDNEIKNQEDADKCHSLLLTGVKKRRPGMKEEIRKLVFNKRTQNSPINNFYDKLNNKLYNNPKDDNSYKIEYLDPNLANKTQKLYLNGNTLQNRNATNQFKVIQYGSVIPQQEQIKKET